MSRFLSRAAGAALAALVAANAAAAGPPAAWLRAAADPDGRPKLLRAMAAERFRGGFEDMAPLANALVEASRHASGPVAFELASLAAAAAPSEVPPRLRLLALGAGERQPIAFFVRNLSALVASAAGDVWVQARLAAWAALVLWGAALAAAAALTLAAVPAGARLLFHDYRDGFPAPVRRFTPAALAAAAAAVTLAGAGVGPLLACGLLGLALAAYLSPRGRWALGVSLALACAAYPSVGWYARLSSPRSERAWALYRVAKGDGGTALARALAAAPGADEVPMLVARSLVARRSLHYGEASAFLRRALDRGGSEALVRLELGNLHFVQRQYGEAASEYERAAAADPNDPRPWLNLHVAHLKRLALADADRALERAKALDSGAAGVLQAAQGGESAPLVPMTVGLPAAWVRQAVWAPAREGETWPGRLWSSLVLAWVHPAALGVLALLGAWAFGTKGRERLSRACPRCGVAVCPRCGRRVKGTDHCSACWAIVAQKGGDAAERARQQQVMAAWTVTVDRRSRFGGALLPGWGEYVYGGGPWVLVVAVLWSLAAGAVVASLLYPVPALPEGRAGFSWGGAVVAVALHLDGLRRALRGQGPARRS